MITSPKSNVAAVLFLCFVLCRSVRLTHRSNPVLDSNKSGGVPVVHMVAQGSTMNASVPFNVLDYDPTIGEVFAFYYSRYSQQKVTLMKARSYKPMSEVPSDSTYIYDGPTMLPRGKCPLKLIEKFTNYPSDQREANLRLAELALCEVFYDKPCAKSDKACSIEIFAPTPYSRDQEPYVAAGMALVAHSLLCAERKSDPWTTEACKIDVSRAGISAGLQRTAEGIKLRPLPGVWVDMKLDACYELRFSETVFAAPNQADYADSRNRRTKHNVTAWQREPPVATFCSDLSCLIHKFER